MLPLLGNNTSIPSTWFLSYHWSLGNCPYYSLLQLNYPCIHRIILYTQHTAQVWMNISSSFFHSLDLPTFPRHMVFITLVHICKKEMGNSTPTESFPNLLLFSCTQWMWKHDCLTSPFTHCSSRPFGQALLGAAFRSGWCSIIQLLLLRSKDSRKCWKGSVCISGLCIL